MLPFDATRPTSDDDDANRWATLGYGAVSPLWFPFLMAAGAGVGFWMLTGWTRRAMSAAEAPAGAAAVGGTVAAPPAAEPDLAPSKLDRPEQVMAHNPPPAEAGRSEPADPAPPPPVPAEAVMDHAPPQSVEMPGNPDAERRMENARSEEPDDLGEESGGEAALLGETSAALAGGTADFGGDFRADDEATKPSPAPEAEADDGADMVDAAYAANFGPVVTPEPGGPPKTSRSRKGRVPPGTPPG